VVDHVVTADAQMSSGPSALTLRACRPPNPEKCWTGPKTKSLGGAPGKGEEFGAGTRIGTQRAQQG
jgi:hypothetical protein